MNSIVVTGGAGYIGSHICKTLYQQGYHPITVDNLVKGQSAAVRWGPLERGDIRDERFLDDLFNRHRPLAVVHCAGLAEVGESIVDPAAYYQNNVVGSLALLDSMHRWNIRILLFSSSCAVYGHAQQIPITENAPQAPVSPYGWSKLMTERLLIDYSMAYGMRCAFLRYFNASGADPEGEIGESHYPETHLVPLIFQAAVGQIPHLKLFGDCHETKDGTPIRDYIHVTDLAEAHVKTLFLLLKKEVGCLSLNLGSGQGFSVREVIRTAELVCGLKIPVCIESARRGDPPVLIANIDKAKSLLNWSPRHSSLDSILISAWAWSQKLLTVS